MSQIWACYSIYNAEDFLRASIETVIRYVDKVLIIDGRYETYGSGKWESTDATKTIIDNLLIEYPDKIDFLWAGPHHTQVSKRNIYMEEVPIDDWIFVIDHDELLFGNNHFLRDEISRYEQEGHRILRFKQEDSDGRQSLRPKLFRKVEGLRYRNYHFNINTPDDHRSWKSILGVDAPVIQCTKFIHLSTDLRSDRVREEKETFGELRNALEAPSWMFDRQIEYYRKLVEYYDKETQQDPQGDNIPPEMKEWFDNRIQGLEQ